MNEKYKKFLTNVNGKPRIYVQLRKALYGTLQAAYLFWCDLSKELTGLGFKINPYDQCVANMEVDGSQCTIVWHVDDLKISHRTRKTIEDVIRGLSRRYGKVKPLTVNIGKIHDYIGMTLDFSLDGKVQIIRE